MNGGKKFFGEGIPGVDPSELRGAFIVVEGADCSGRSNQIQTLKDHLEQQGHAVADVGLKRSALIAEELEAAKGSNTISPRTLSLFYATDFADQLEHKIIPALKAGYVVLADRYFYTLIARDVVRGATPDWVESLYGIALVPDAVFYLSVTPRNLAIRTFEKYHAFDYWESGMDLHLSLDWYTCFVSYQRKMAVEFKQLSKQFGFRVINGNRSVRSISLELTKEVDMLMERLRQGDSQP